MAAFEYKVIPAPRRGDKARGAKTTADRFAAALSQVMNDLGRDGWEYLRADTLPCEERAGLTGKTTAFQHMLVFRRAAAPAQVGASPHLAEPLAIAAPLVADPAPQGSAPPIATPANDAPSAAPPLGPAQRADAASG